jgi:hypothetical protein
MFLGLWITSIFFVSQSRAKALSVHLHPHAFNCQDDDVWHKLGQALGNLQAPETLYFSTSYRSYDDHGNDLVLPTPDWEERELACILSHVRQKVRVEFGVSDLRAAGEVQAIARGIRGQPTITNSNSGYKLPFEYMDSLYSALALESIRLSDRTRPKDETTLARLIPRS